VNTEITDNNVTTPAGWVFYDGECSFCVRGAARWGGLFAQRGFRWLPLQTPGTAERLGLNESALRAEMKVLLRNGRIVGGVEAWAALFHSVWWLWPLGALLGMPSVRWLGSRVYHWIAAHRYCFAASCEVRKRGKARRHSAFFEMP
jgi:predicted DCC family thiol-disulfide oxidoreductase YuxK